MDCRVWAKGNESSSVAVPKVEKNVYLRNSSPNVVTTNLMLS